VGLTCAGSTGAGWRVTVARAEGGAAGTGLLAVTDWLVSCMRKISTAATMTVTAAIVASHAG